MSVPNPAVLRQKLDSYVQNTLKLPKDSFTFVNSYRTASMRLTHFYLQQRIDGLDVSNGQININIRDNGEIKPNYNTFAKSDAPIRHWNIAGNAATTPSSVTFISARKALNAFADKAKLSLSKSIQIHEVSTPKSGESTPEPTDLSSFDLPSLDAFNDEKEEVSAQRTYLILKDGSVAPTWSLDVQLPRKHYQVHVDAMTGDVLQTSDLVSNGF
ncbi:hypothetical protein THASP1DRAFT_30353 [Thamnocephalis sphaerospora]|uniref:FTP domain-containing protein n=1 Tax=Thamnocephalis sphaerospora TaxID=78915 RepID=A0A4P9XPC5_9FUNG|nr:hypothetical protein THASP1DRAFT_30353 [Thamnocephalis sphaerospora]|eukprot:RKP07836.1 hypothetical protein THASP1DRAFT_30353 [Thamnocephalis sphaerospora]